jgi:sulfur transfer complex TusBCD TusB component (DsrH family)
VAEGLLHLVFSPSGLSGLPSRVGAGDCVVMMLGSSALIEKSEWPCGVRVFTLKDSAVGLSGPDRIDYREFVGLTLSYSRILSW